jgi:ERCC4-type nuclease
MRPKDIKTILDSMTVLVDSREQDTDRARWRYASIGLPVERCVLDYGDYSYNATLLDGRKIYDISDRIRPTVAIERKMSLDELAACFGSGRERFEREFQRSTDAGAQMWLLVEGGSWENIYDHRYKSQMLPRSFVGSILAFCRRYNLRLAFCTERMTGKIIRGILERDLEDRLKAGEFG